MNKKKFLNDLRYYLRHLSEYERGRSINYYEELIADYMEEGISEEQAIERLGDPEKIAAEILRENMVVTPTSTTVIVEKRGMSFGMKVLVAILVILALPLWGPLLIGAVALLLGGIVLLFVPVIVLGALAIGLVFAALVAIAGSFVLLTTKLVVGIFQLGIGIAALGAAIITIILLYYVTKWIIKAFIFICKKIAGLFRKKEVR